MRTQTVRMLLDDQALAELDRRARELFSRQGTADGDAGSLDLEGIALEAFRGMVVAELLRQGQR